MRLIATALAMIFTSLSAAVCAEPLNYEAQYTLSIGALNVAKMTRRFELDGDGHYRYTSDIRTTGLASFLKKDKIAESSEGLYVDGQFTPLRYRYVRTNKKKARNIATDFQRDAGLIATVYNGEQRDLTFSETMLDKLAYQAALALDLAAGKSELRYTVNDRGREKQYEPVIVGNETISTSLGDVETIKVIRASTTDKRRTVLWCAPSLNYIPVKVIHTDKEGAETLVRISRYTKR